MTAPRDAKPDEAAAGGSIRVVLVALGGNMAIALIKFIAFGFTRSTAMLTEAIHSVVDSSDQLLLLVAQKRAVRPANDRHPFGYGMETYFWSFIVVLMIFLAGGAVAVWEGFQKILHPHPITQPWISLGVLAASAVFEGLSFRTAYREFRDIVQGRDIRLLGFLKISKDPSVFATLLEDGAALTGLAIAALGIVLSAFAGQLWGDGAASVGIGLLLVCVAGFMANETRSLIAGEAAAPPIVQAVSDTLTSCTQFGTLGGLKTLHLGPETILVALDWRFAASLNRIQVEAAAREMKRRLCAADDRIAYVLFETPLQTPQALAGAPVPGRGGEQLH